jgi:Ran GTPase-activating protein (RanGAP) involved in mRNA processing and transport
VATALPGPLMLECRYDDDADVTQLAESLRVNATVTSLDLCASRIGAPGATQLADCLRTNATLKSLSLGYTEIGDAGVTQLAKCLRVNTTLKSLNLGPIFVGTHTGRR